MRIPFLPPILSTSGPLIRKEKRVDDGPGGEDKAEILVRHERAERVLRDREIVASHVEERVGHPEREPVNEPPAQKPRPMLERVIIKINPDNQRETDENNAERHATVRNSSPNPARHTRKIFVTAPADDRDQSAGPLGLSAWLLLCEATVQPIRSILFAFVFLRRNDAVFDGIGVHGNADPIEDGEPEPKPRACDRSEARESEHN